MDPTNPRWETSEVRRARSALFWKVIATAAAAAALSTAVVVSCLGRDASHRGLDEPAFVETTAGGAPGTVATRDSTGGISPGGGAGTTSVTAAEVDAQATPPGPPADQPPYTPAPGTVYPYETAQQAGQPASPRIVAPPAAGANAAADGGGASDETQTDAAATATDAGPTTRAGDAGAPQGPPRTLTQQLGGTNPAGPPMTSGAGPFTTEAPYWSASAFETNPEAGAGPFTTERNMPALPPWQW